MSAIYKFRDASVIARKKVCARSISIPKEGNKKKKKKKNRNKTEKINCYKCKSYLGPFQVFSVIDCKLYPKGAYLGWNSKIFEKYFIYSQSVDLDPPSLPPSQLSPSRGGAAINERSSFPGWYARPADPAD